jgi:hypothetical protein
VDFAFMPASELSAAFYREKVMPLLAGQAHAAALLGWGSDVLGYDTERSTDHGWGPRLQIFLRDAEQTGGWSARLDEQLPQQFRGWPVRYGWDATPTQHWVTVTTLRQWSQDHLGADASAGLTTLDWLTIPQQRSAGHRTSVDLRVASASPPAGLRQRTLGGAAGGMIVAWLAHA